MYINLKKNWTTIDTETGPHECSSGPVYYNQVNKHTHTHTHTHTQHKKGKAELISAQIMTKCGDTQKIVVAYPI